MFRHILFVWTESSTIILPTHSFTNPDPTSAQTLLSRRGQPSNVFWLFIIIRHFLSTQLKRQDLFCAINKKWTQKIVLLLIKFSLTENECRTQWIAISFSEQNHNLFDFMFAIK